MSDPRLTSSPDALVINDRLRIPQSELRFTFSRSSGPGGQNVNKVNTRVTLHWNPGDSSALTFDQLAKIRHHLASRITDGGTLHISSSRHRTQNANRAAAIQRMIELLASALRPVKPRGKTRPTAGSKVRRLQGKKSRSQIKQQRRAVGPEKD